MSIYRARLALGIGRSTDMAPARSGLAAADLFVGFTCEVAMLVSADSPPPPGILLTLPDGTVQTANDAAKKMFNRPQGRRCLEVLATTGCPETLPCKAGCVAALFGQGPGAHRHAHVMVRGTSHGLTCVAANAHVIVVCTPRGGDSESWMRLTGREKEVVTLVSHGLNTRRIAEELKVSEATVRSHLEHVRVRLGVPSRAALVAAALRSGIIR